MNSECISYPVNPISMTKRLPSQLALSSFLFDGIDRHYQPLLSCGATVYKEIVFEGVCDLQMVANYNGSRWMRKYTLIWRTQDADELVRTSSFSITRIGLLFTID